MEMTTAVRGISDSALATLSRLVEAGGPVVIILLGMSVLAATIVAMKLWQFRAAGIGDIRTPRRAAELYATGDSTAARALLGHPRQPVQIVLDRAMAGRASSDGALESLRETLARIAADQLEALRSYLRPLEVIATLAPLLGLFGTVLGMIEAFRELEMAGTQVSPAVLSSGIWQALLTTAVGLGVAIPTVAMLSWLERRVDRAAHEMETTVSRVLTAPLPGQSDDTDEPGNLAEPHPVGN
ncbi:MotA/TolQ/ExbB proton channel family protein [Aquisalimonas sp.]|uniref:MotA/TolQ/ExbB proton channel family protein n=1 Tax=Aquisalimonas sp. TaxID=1872621 RepID=UPI0025C66190|nr:MotA/TolQ/ExbB proton channel family protein [Aquisalimonas sp.]